MDDKSKRNILIFYGDNTVLIARDNVARIIIILPCIDNRCNNNDQWKSVTIILQPLSTEMNRFSFSWLLIQRLKWNSSVESYYFIFNLHASTNYYNTNFTCYMYRMKYHKCPTRAERF